MHDQEERPKDEISDLKQVTRGGSNNVIQGDKTSKYNRMRLKVYLSWKNYMCIYHLYPVGHSQRSLQAFLASESRVVSSK